MPDQTTASGGQKKGSPIPVRFGMSGEEIYNGIMATIEPELVTTARDTLDAKYKEYETKLKTYQGSAATMVDAIRKDKETELTQLQENIQKFQQDAQTSLQKKQTDLMEPVFGKVAKAIEEVAKENAYSFILTPQIVGGGDVLLYHDEKYNISTLVLKKLGITPVAAALPK